LWFSVSAWYLLLWQRPHAGAVSLIPGSVDQLLPSLQSATFLLKELLCEVYWSRTREFPFKAGHDIQTHIPQLRIFFLSSSRFKRMAR
jgi:hypothetical protein